MRSLALFILKIVPIHLIQLVTGVLPNCNMTTRIRGFLVGKFFLKTGKRFKLASGLIINHPERLIVGDDVYIAHNCWINAAGNVNIASNTMIGPYCVIASANHLFEKGKLTQKFSSKKITIGENVWIGSHVVLLAGSSVKNNSVIGAGSIVNSQLLKSGLYVGVPAEYKKEL